MCLVFFGGAVVVAINVLLLTDGVLSHVHQSRGLLRILSSNRPLATQDFAVQMHSDWMRGFLRKALSMDSDVSLSWAAHCFNWPAYQYRKPDLIVSAGSETMLVNAVLAQLYQCDNVFIGGEKGLRCEWFNAVLTLDAPTLANTVAMTLPPSRLTPDVADQALAAYLAAGCQSKGSCWAMILGGNGGGCHYSDLDWQTLIDGMNQLAKTHKIKWLVVTTRFASDKVQSLLKHGLHKRSVESITSYGTGLEDPLPLLAGRAERIYCGAEHVPILFDCVASGKPTVAIVAAHRSTNRQAQHLMNTLRLERLLSVLKIEELASGRTARPALPLGEVLARKYAQLFKEVCSRCPSLAAEGY